MWKAAHFDDSRYLGVDVVVGEVQACSEGALVEQRVLVELNLPTRVPLVQTHRAVREINHLSQNQIRSWTAEGKRSWHRCKGRARKRDTERMRQRQTQSEIETFIN